MSTNYKDNTAAQIRELAEVALDKAINQSLNLSAEDSDYDLNYLSQKLTQVAVSLESMGEISINLTKMALEVTKSFCSSKSLLALKDREFRDDPIYKDGVPGEKTAWLSKKLEVFRIEFEDWQLTHSYLNEIRAAVNDRIQLFKRLDSDLRLQQKIVEAKLGVGAMGAGPSDRKRGGSFPRGEQAGIPELEID